MLAEARAKAHLGGQRHGSPVSLNDGASSAQVLEFIFELFLGFFQEV